MRDFRSMSDLVADAEDLVSKFGSSNTPEVRALKDKVEVTIAEMKARLRQKVRAGAYTPASSVNSVGNVMMAHPWIVAFVGALVAAALLNAVSRPRPNLR